MPKSVEAQTYNIRQVQDALKATGELIATARKERKWSQSELGKRLGGVDRRHISALENGDPAADFGLVVSALWVLNLPLLSTLPLSAQESSGTVGSLVDALVNLSSRSRPRTSASVTRNAAAHGVTGRVTGKKVIDNDF
ncbi:helix-turn-helix transcriptional regulator [Marinobacter sp. ATCH36]|uniref:helix-turn-helix transcriptional regulator n=1 Tax=Marinobacter sp. ATCH36 TaxID=2945106 RepID=UPI0020215250|nr:helix-turn-helix transcriptional regulator [Marinobacter sp. ATCH36]MCL7943410.1 helix-turn-helix domain-containing protein [Marinobacter sp. ATCH36]